MRFQKQRIGKRIEKKFALFVGIMVFFSAFGSVFAGEDKFPQVLYEESVFIDMGKTGQIMGLDLDIDVPDPDPDKDKADPDPDKDKPDPDPDKDKPDPDPDKDKPGPDPDKDKPDPDLDKDKTDPDLDKDKTDPDPDPDKEGVGSDPVPETETEDQDLDEGALLMAMAEEADYPQGTYEDGVFTITIDTLTIDDITDIHAAVSHGDTIYFPAGTYYLNLDGAAARVNDRAWTVNKNLTFLGEVAGGELKATIQWSGSAAGSTYMFTAGAPGGAVALPNNCFTVVFKNLIFDGKTAGGTAMVRSAFNLLNQTNGNNRKDSDFRIENCIIQNTNTLSYSAINNNQGHLTIDGLTTINSGRSVVEFSKGSGTQWNDAELVLVGRGIVSTSNRGSLIYINDIPETDPRYSIDNSGVTSGFSALLGRTGTSLRSYYPLAQLVLTHDPSSFTIAPSDEDDLAYTGTDISLDFTSADSIFRTERAPGVTWPAATNWPARNVKIVVTAADTGDVLYEGPVLTNRNVLNSGTTLKGDFPLSGDYKGSPVTYMNYPDEVTLAVIDANENVLPAVVRGSTTASDMEGFVYASSTIALNIGPPLYSVTYDLNGGGGTAPVETNKPADAVFTAASPAGLIAPEGKQYKEWNTESEGTGTAYAEGVEITMPASNLVLFAIWEDAPVEPEYTIIAGENSVWRGEENTGLMIVCDGDFDKFEGLRINGILINPDFYTAVPGSTIVTLKPEYLKTLASGTHKIVFIYTDGEVETEFLIHRSEDNNNSGRKKHNNNNSSNSTNIIHKNNIPLTGDINLAFIFITTMLSFAGMIFFTKRLSRNNKDNLNSPFYF